MRRVAALAAIFAVLAVPSVARASEPARTGTITGWGYTWPAMFSGEARNCQWNEGPSNDHAASLNAECRAWLDSGCNPALAGRDPAVTASIEAISDLADGTTIRTFQWDAATTPEGDLGGVVVQMWKGDCTEIRDADWWEWRSANRQGTYCCSWVQEKTTTFAIPRTARWMTVTTNDTVRVQWTLS